MPAVGASGTPRSSAPSSSGSGSGSGSDNHTVERQKALFVQRAKRFLCASLKDSVPCSSNVQHGGFGRGGSASGSGSSSASRFALSRGGRLLPTEHLRLSTICRTSFRTRASTCVLVVGPVGSGKDAFVNSFLAAFRGSEGDVDGDGDADEGKAASVPAPAPAPVHVPAARRAYRVAVIDGNVIETDAQAIAALADQLLVQRGGGGGGAGANAGGFATDVEALKACFGESYTDSEPVVIVVRNVDRFARRGRRQVFLYLLLDLMQRKDLLFLVIGLTANAQIHSLLEKRVTSRLNAQYIYMPSLTAAECCLDLAAKLLLPESEGAGAEGTEEQRRWWAEEGEGSDSSGSDSDSDGGCGRDRGRRQRAEASAAACMHRNSAVFNEAVVRLLLDDAYRLPQLASGAGAEQRKTPRELVAALLRARLLSAKPAKETATAGASTGGARASSGAASEAAAPVAADLCPGSGSLRPLLHVAVQWGKEYDYFVSAVFQAVHGLSPRRPLLTYEAMAACLSGTMDQHVGCMPVGGCLGLLLGGGLSRCELYVLLAVLRLYRYDDNLTGRRVVMGGSASEGGAGGAASDSAAGTHASQGWAVTWAQVQGEFSRLCRAGGGLGTSGGGGGGAGAGEDAAVPYGRLVAALQVLVNCQLLAVTGTAAHAPVPAAAGGILAPETVMAGAGGRAAAATGGGGGGGSGFGFRPGVGRRRSAFEVAAQACNNTLGAVLSASSVVYPRVPLFELRNAFRVGATGAAVGEETAEGGGCDGVRPVELWALPQLLQDQRAGTGTGLGAGTGTGTGSGSGDNERHAAPSKRARLSVVRVPETVRQAVLNPMASLHH